MPVSIVCAVDIESKEQCRVVVVVALEMAAGESPAIDDVMQANDSAELRFEIDLVAFVRDKIHIALALIKRLDELFEICLADGYFLSTSNIHSNTSLFPILSLALTVYTRTGRLSKSCKAAIFVYDA